MTKTKQSEYEKKKEENVTNKETYQSTSRNSINLRFPKNKQNKNESKNRSDKKQVVSVRHIYGETHIRMKEAAATVAKKKKKIRLQTIIAHNPFISLFCRTRKRTVWI